MILILVTFVLPVETLLIPRYVMFNSYKMLDSPLPLWISALTGQGLKSAVFILVFQQVFNGYPISLDEAAELGGQTVSGSNASAQSEEGVLPVSGESTEHILGTIPGADTVFAVVNESSSRKDLYDLFSSFLPQSVLEDARLQFLGNEE